MLALQGRSPRHRLYGGGAVSAAEVATAGDVLLEARGVAKHFPVRKGFLKRRIAYWDEWQRRGGTGIRNMGDRE